MKAYPGHAALAVPLILNVFLISVFSFIVGLEHVDNSAIVGDAQIRVSPYVIGPLVVFGNYHPSDKKMLEAVEEHAGLDATFLNLFCAETRVRLVQEGQ